MNKEPMARTRTRAKKKASDKHKEYIQKYRQDDDYTKNENKQKILRRVAKGAIPQANTLEKYEITLKDVNRIRVHEGYSEIDLKIPYFMKARTMEERQNNLDYLPDNDVVFGNFNQDDGTIMQDYVAEIPEEEVVEDNEVSSKEPEGGYKFSSKEVSIWFQDHPEVQKASSVREDVKSAATIEMQFGGKRSKKRGETGQLHLLMKKMGNTYMEDIRKAMKLPLEFYENLFGETWEKFKKDKNKPYMDAESRNRYFTTLLIVMRQYPPINATVNNGENRQYWEKYKEYDKFYSFLKARQSAETLANPKTKDPIMEWNTLFKRIIEKYKEPLSVENLYIRMYDEFPCRDDFKELFINDKDLINLEDKNQVENVRKNSIFTKTDVVKLVLKEYKTATIYGTRTHEFSSEVSKDIKEFIIKNKVKNYLFGTKSLTGMVKKMLNTIENVPPAKSREGHINYLRKSYISTAIEKVKDNAEERMKLAFHMMHSPAASLKYIRELQDLNVNNIIKTKTNEIEIAESQYRKE